MRLSLLTAGLAAPLALAQPAMAATVTALTSDNTLLRFASATPGMVSAPVAIGGLAAGESVRGIDTRPMDGRLYGIVSQADGSAARLVKINRTTGMTRAVAPLASNPANSVLAAGTDPVAIRGQLVGVDFNPVPDLLRVVTDQEQNLRINPGERAAGGPAGATAIDGALNLGGPPAAGLNIVSAAYTNSFKGATSTVLYTLDSVSDQLFIQDPPNAGNQGSPIRLSVNAVGAVGFDILGATMAFASFATDEQGAPAGLFLVDLASGIATALGTIGGQTGTTRVTDITVTPVPAALPLLASALVGLGLAARRRRRTA